MKKKIIYLLLLLAALNFSTAYTENSNCDCLQTRSSRKKNQEQTKHFCLLITGCARSGTTYIAEALSANGLDIGHELLGKDGCSSWFMCVGDGFSDAPWKGRATAKGLHFEHVFHQVRNPLKVISSVYSTEHPKAIQFFSANIPEIDPWDSHIVKCAKYWYYWNLYAEKKAEWRYQVEKIEDIWEELGQRLGMTLDQEILKNVSKTSNHRASVTQFTWFQLSQLLPGDLFIKLQEMALRYGYAIDDHPKINY